MYLSDELGIICEHLTHTSHLLTCDGVNIVSRTGWIFWVVFAGKL